MAHLISGHAGQAPGVHFSGPIHIKTTLDDGSPHLTGLTPIVFSVDGVTSNTSATSMRMWDAANQVVNHIAPFAGSIVAITGHTNQNVASSSNVTFVAYIGGVAQTGMLDQSIAAAASLVTASTTNLTSFTFAAGDRIAMKFECATVTDPAVDLVATLWTV